MLVPVSRIRAALSSSRHFQGFQSFLVLSIALGSFAGSLPGGSFDPKYGQVPLTFVANRGQVHHSVRFTARGPGLTAYFTPEEVVVDVRGAVVRMKYLGANLMPEVGGADLQEGHANYLIGNDPRQWKTNIPLYGRVAYKELYPGIDMVYSSHSRLLKSEFVVAPGADPSRIQIEYSGIESLRVDDRGALVFTTKDGELRENAPEIYQESGSGRDPVEGAFRVSGRIVSFFVGDYDRSRPLRIDPVLSYSTYLSGAGTDKAYAIAVDGTGAAYVTGYTDSTNFPMTGGVVRPANSGGVDAFVTKLNAAGNAIVYSTYLGGSGDDRAFSIAVDGPGNAYITGWTGSTDFPSASAFQSAFGGTRDAFVAKLNSSGTALIYSTYLGGSGTDVGNGIALDVSGAAYVTGSTTSTNFPVSGAYQSTLIGQQDGFVTKLNAAGSAIVYSTYLGGSLDDRGSSIAVDSSGSAYVTGTTHSTNFPVVAALQSAYGGATDAFITKLSASGSSLLYSTYLGGSGTENTEIGHSIAVDSAGSAYVTGATSSTNFALFGPLQAQNNGGGHDAFVVKVTPAGTAFAYSTYLGGSSIDYGESIAVDSSGYAYVAGYTSSVDFPTASADQPANGGGYDVFIAKLNSSGNALVESGFLGGSGSDTGYGIAVDTSANAYVTGQTISSNFPLKGAIQSSNGTTLAAFVSKFTFGSPGPPTAVSVSPSSGSGGSQTFTLTYSDPRGFADMLWVEANWNITQATTGACYVRYDRVFNLLFLSNDAGSGWVGSATPGAAGSLTNSQCTINAAASFASASGTNLTLYLAVTFTGSFAGTKDVSLRPANSSGVFSAWQTLGTWTVPAAAATPPANVSVNPPSGSGSVQVFTVVYSDPNGYTDINWVDVLFHNQLAGANACFVQYFRATNALLLVADSGSGNAGTATVGVPGPMSNSQCTVDSVASSVSASGNTLTLTLAVTFKPAFIGAKNIYMGVVNNANVFSGWQAKGTWTASGALPPAAVSVSPSSGTGSVQVFSFVYSDAQDINWVNILFQTEVTGANACFVQYFRAANFLLLVGDSGSGNAGTATPGFSGPMSNSQCSVDPVASSVSTSGNNLTLNLALTFKPAFAGAKNIYMALVNNANVFSGWQTKGTWTASGTLPPAVVSVSPSSGTGATQTFTFVYSGVTEINWVNILFQTQVAGANACFVQYFRATNALLLVGDSGSGNAGTATLGSPGPMSNSQCTVDSVASSLSISGSNLILNLALTFKPAFAGTKNIYMGVVNNASVFSGWQVQGTWTVSGSLPPAVVSVSPSSGAGTTQTFTFVYSDAQDINWVNILFQTQVTGANACFVQYFRPTNSLLLVGDSGSGNAGTATPGLAGPMSNSQCTIDPVASAVSGAGNTLTLNLAVSFKPAFNGAKNVYTGLFNNANSFSGWQLKGTWTVQ